VKMVLYSQEYRSCHDGSPATSPVFQ
jgi:hypothetical protein